jgi:hypothetical protein
VTRIGELGTTLAVTSNGSTLTPIAKRSILMLSIHLRLGLPSGLFLSGFPYQ